MNRNNHDVVGFNTWSGDESPQVIVAIKVKNSLEFSLYMLICNSHFLEKRQQRDWKEKASKERRPFVTENETRTGSSRP